ncbi:MAG: hypothetical protein NDI94_02845 [Candidatus Woesearchaeota archaeon]|nr:hypothetical protein [Candidatus Woesearchaeota archaeon]
MLDLSGLARTDIHSINDARDIVTRLLDLAARKVQHGRDGYFVIPQEAGNMVWHGMKEFFPADPGYQGYLKFYHVAYLSQKNRIFEHGIIHCPEPTITPYLPGAYLYALGKLNDGYYPSILQVTIPKEDIFFVMHDRLGPGFLPKKTIPFNAIKPDVEVPWSLFRFFIEYGSTSKLYHIEANYLHEFYEPRLDELNAVRGRFGHFLYEERHMR